MNKIKNIAVFASADKKTDLIEWSYFNRQALAAHNILAFGDAANILEGTLNTNVKLSTSGKMGEYAELNALIENKQVDAVIIFYDTTEMFNNKGLTGIIESAIRNNIILSTNRTTADFSINSTLIEDEYAIQHDEKKTISNYASNSGRHYPLAKAS